MSTLAKFMIVVGADIRPPMLDKSMYESWKIRMELYIQENDTVRPKTYEELSDKEKLQADCDLKATNIILQGLPPDVYSLVNYHRVSKEIWDRVKLLMQGTSLSKQERECKLYDEFDKFTHVKGETFLPPEWSKFVTDVKLARDLHTSNYDQLYAYLEQHEAHANEAFLMHERFPDPLALVVNYHQPPSHFNNYHSQYTTHQYQQQFSPPTQHVYSHTQPSVPQNTYPPPTIPQQLQAEFLQLDLGLAVLTFLPGDDPIACMNKAMAFFQMCFHHVIPQPIINSYLLLIQGIKPLFKMVESPFNKFKEDKVRMLSVQDHKGMLQVHGEIHQVKQKLSSAIIVKVKGTWLDSVLSQREEGMQHGLRRKYCLFKHILRTITHNGAFQTDDLDAYDSGCDDISSAKAVRMANLSSCDSYVVSENSNKNSEEPSTSNALVKIEVPIELSKLHAKDTVITKLKEIIHSLRDNANPAKVKKDIDEIETINIELEHNLKAQIQEKIDLEPLAPKVLKNKDAHIDYIKHSREHADILQEIVKNARALSPLDSNLDSACKYVQRIQEMLVYIKDTCPCLTKRSEKLVVVTPKNKDKKVRFADPIISSSSIQEHVDSHKTQDSNQPLLHFTRVIYSTGASGSKPEVAAPE
ncbi:hypothetical protein Tco_0449820 [Tanacetum coccineum]